MNTAGFHEHPFVRDLNGEQLSRLRSCAREVRYEDGAFIFREGGRADSLFLLTGGCVVLEQHIPAKGPVRLESLCPGDILGLAWLSAPGRWTADARCLEKVTAFALPAEGLRERMREDPALGVELLGRVVSALYERLVRVRLQRLDLYKAGD